MNSSNVNEVVIAYIPVLHKGYLSFLEKHPDSDIFLVPGEMAGERYLQKDLRAVPTDKMELALFGLFPYRNVQILDQELIEEIIGSGWIVYMPDEDISRSLKKRYFGGNIVRLETTFLRYDKMKVSAEQPIEADRILSRAEFSAGIFEAAEAEAVKSSDWWLQVGAVFFKEGKMILSGHNTHLPEPDAPCTLGDPRALFSRGVSIEMTSALHAEANVLSSAARQGIRTEGGEMYVKFFPCPPCAKLIANSGIQRLYFFRGYSLLDGQEILRVSGIEIIKVE